jgi:phosphoglycolate phosphatase
MTDPAPLRGLLFDKDGTLFGFQETWAGWAAALIDDLAAGDGPRATALAGALGLDRAALRFRRDSVAIAGTEAEVVAHMLPHLPGMNATSLVARLAETAAALVPVEAVPLAPLIARLRDAGYALGVATNDGEVATRAQLARVGLEGAFDFVAGYDSGHGAKPDPGPCLAFAAAAGLDPALVAMIGDSTHDLHAGRAAGMLAVGVLTGPASEADLAPHADLILPDIGHLPRWLRLD